MLNYPVFRAISCTSNKHDKTDIRYQDFHVSSLPRRQENPCNPS